MFTPDQVRPYLNHEDTLVSNGAIQYFADSYRYTDGIMKLVLDKLASTAKQEDVYLHQTGNFPQTSESVAIIIDLLRSGSLKTAQLKQLEQILLNSKPSLLEAALDDIALVSDQLGQKALEHIRLGQLEPSELLNTFEQMIEASKGLQEDELEYDYLDYLVTELIDHGGLTSEQVLDKLKAYQSQEEENFENYEIVYYVQAAGRLKLTSVIEQLVDFLASDYDLLVEQAQDALVRIGSNEAADKLFTRYQQEHDDYFKIYAAETLGRMSTPEAESYLLQLLQKERNLTHITKLAGSLCQLGSAQSIPVIAKLIEIGYDEDYLDLREALYINCIINQTLLPELAGWRKEIAKADANRIANARQNG